MCKEESLWKLLGSKTDVSTDASLLGLLFYVYLFKIDSINIVISTQK